MGKSEPNNETKRKISIKDKDDNHLIGKSTTKSSFADKEKLDEYSSSPRS